MMPRHKRRPPVRRRRYRLNPKVLPTLLLTLVAVGMVIMVVNLLRPDSSISAFSQPTAAPTEAPTPEATLAPAEPTAEPTPAPTEKTANEARIRAIGDVMVHDDELASALHLSAPYLSSLFRRETGCSFRQYLLRVRMEKARSLIRSGDRSLAEVARDVGYTDYAQFSKTYKTYFGISPRSDFTNIKKTQLDGCSSSKTLK